MDDDWKQLSLSEVARLIAALKQTGLDLTAIHTIIERVPQLAVPHGRITLESLLKLLDQTNGSTVLPEELTLLLSPDLPLVVQPNRLLIDTAAPPISPWTDEEGNTYLVESHDMNVGLWLWDPRQIVLFDIDEPIAEIGVDHTALEQHFAARNAAVLNATVLDFLLSHQELIPPEWKGKNIFFAGTTYLRAQEEDEYEDNQYAIRCLTWQRRRGWCGLIADDIEALVDEDFLPVISCPLHT